MAPDPPALPTRGPDLFLAGAPKSGTSALYQYLRDHPRIFLSEHKEPHFFDRPEPALADGLEAYLGRFAGAGPHHEAIGEGSTGYLSSPFALPNIRRFREDARIVAMLRNPLELVQSLHAEQCYRLFEDESDFAAAWSLQAARRRGDRLPKTNPSGIQPRMLQYEAVARLGEQVARLLETFPREQVHLIVFDDFALAPAAAYAGVLGFLGLPFAEPGSYPRVNARRRLRWPALARRLAQPPLRLSSAARALKRRLGAEGVELLRPVRRGLARLNTRPAPTRPLSRELRAELAELFAPDVALLSSTLGRDLRHWLRGDPASAP